VKPKAQQKNQESREKDSFKLFFVKPQAERKLNNLNLTLVLNA
jgi:hypothetical protein